MRIFPVIVKKVVAAAVQSANFLPSVKPAVALGTVLTSLTNTAPGLNLVGSLWYGTVPETPAVSLAASLSGSSTSAVAPAPALGTTLTNVGGTSERDIPATKTKQVKLSLTHNAGATGQTSTGTWTSGASATGKHDGANAVNANTITAAASGALTLSYAAQATRSALRILSVTLNHYGTYTAGLTGPGTVLVEYSTNGGSTWTTWESRTTSYTNNVNSRALDITATIGQDWSLLANLQVRITFTAAASATVSTINVDAVEIIVTAVGQDAYDRFNRADGSLTTADSGQTWNVVTGAALEVISNQCGSSGVVQRVNTIDSGLADCNIAATLAVIGASAGLVFRRAGNSWLMVKPDGHIYSTTDNSAFTDLAATTSSTFTSGDKLLVTLDGSSITVTKNGGTAVCTLTSTFNQTATEHGLRSKDTAAIRWDDFGIYPL